MLILTAANKDKAKNDSGKVYKNFSFVGVINSTKEKAESLGYKVVVYDLGQLGFGDRYVVKDSSFMENGYYSKEVKSGYKSKSLFKPDIVNRSLSAHNDTVVYLDGDAQLLDSIDEIDTDDYDVGVTLRDKSELEGEWYESHSDIVKYVNAGVIFFRATDATNDFVSRWDDLTQSLGNDQMALNELTCPDFYPEPGSVHTIDGVRVKYFPGCMYNYYYFDSSFPSEAKILHFKGPVRHYYPFDWKKKMHCRYFNPFKNVISKIVR